MRRVLASMCIALAFGCERRGATRAESAEAKSATAPSPAGMPEMRVGSAAFHLEVGGVYERYMDHKSAIDHLSQAADLAEDSVQRVQAYSALARVKEAAGDRDGAIGALERAQSEIDKAKAGGPPGGPEVPGPFAAPGGDDVLLRLARLYGEKGRHEQAESLCQRGLSSAREPWQREEFQRLEVELYRKSGTLEKRISEKQKALDPATRDESALRFLAVALAGAGMAGPTPTGGVPGRPQADSSRLIRVYERLHALHPDDPQLRHDLQSLLERAGRIDEAVALAAAPPLVTPMECTGAFGPPLASPVLQGAAEAIRIRARAGQVDRALSETAKLAALAKIEGIPAYLVAAELHLERGAAETATQLIAQAAREARSREDQRQVAFARERTVGRTGQADDLRALHDEWRKSDDPCLRLAAAQREQQQAMVVAGPPMPSSTPAR